MIKYNIKKEIINDIVLYDKIMNYDTIRNNIVYKSKELVDIEVKAKEYYNTIIEKIRNNERGKKNDPDYKEQVKKRALERYYRIKEAKLNASISVS
jgi:hypothetical protein